MYYVYMLRTDSGALYTGITPNLFKRIREHLAGGKRGAKYTRSHPVRELACLWSCEDKSAAARLEYYLKTLTKEKKEALILSPLLLEHYFPFLDGKEYLHHPKATLSLFTGEITLSDLP